MLIKITVKVIIPISLLSWSPTTTDDRVFRFSRGRSHMPKRLIVSRGCTVPNPLTWPSTKKSDGTEELATTDSVDGCSVLPESQFVGTCLRVDATRGLYAGGSFPPLTERGHSLTSNRQ